MIVVANTKSLVADGIIDRTTAVEMSARARGIMMSLAINAVLLFGICAATGGLIFWLADASSVAACGTILLVAGLAVLTRGPDLYAMFANASALIGAGMLMGGTGLELTGHYPDMAATIMIPSGALMAALAARALAMGTAKGRFVQGALLVMGVALHLWGAGFALSEADASGPIMPAFYIYASLAIAWAGWVTDVRFITALAIAPFAQALDTGTAYFHAAYVFYSPESTLSIMQMGVLMALVTWWMRSGSDHVARHGGILRIMAFIVANLCALVGSLWGDRVGQTVWGPGTRYRSGNWDSYDAYLDAKEVFFKSSLYIHENTYVVFWALALAVTIAWAAHRGQRGLFNAAITFAAIHAYTQLFETFGNEPLAYVIGGFAAIPAAWGLWRLNQRWVKQSQKHLRDGK